MYKREDQIFVRVNRAGFIPQLGICGPIPNPIKVTCAKCLAMVNAGIDVHQVDPVTRKMVKLTVENLFNDDKFIEKKDTVTVDTKPSTPVAPAPEPIKFVGVAKKEETKVDVNEAAKVEETTPTESTDEKVEEKTDVVEDDKTEEKSNDENKDDTKSNNNNYKNNNKKNKHK